MEGEGGTGWALREPSETGRALTCYSRRMKGWVAGSLVFGAIVVAVVAFAVVYRADEDPQGFWRSFSPAFYANLAAVGIAAAVGVPLALMGNRLWAQHQEEVVGRRRREDAARALQAVRNELFTMQSAVGQIPTHLDGSRSTGGLSPLQVVSMRLQATAWEELKRGNYLNLAGEHALSQSLATLYQQVGNVNELLTQWGNVHTLSAPEDRAASLQGLLVMGRFFCDSVANQATAMLGHVDAAIERLQS